MEQDVQFDHFSNFLNIAKRKNMKNEQEVWEALKALTETCEKEPIEVHRVELSGAVIALRWVLEKLSAVEIVLKK